MNPLTSNATRRMEQQHEIERQERMVAVAVAATDERMKRYLDGLAALFYPDVSPDMVNVPALTTVRVPYTFPGLFYLATIEIFPIEGAFPSRVDVTIERFSHLPFSFTSAKAKAGPLHMRVLGSTDVVFTNLYATQDANVYLEWALIHY